VQLVGRGVIGIRASDGWFMWGNNSVANHIASIPTPVVKDDWVFATSGYDSGGSVILQLSNDGKGRVNATERRFYGPSELQVHHGGSVLIDGVVYGGMGHNNGFPFALELSTGRLLWDRTRGAGTGSAAVTAAEGHLYYRYQDGTMALIAANPKQYQLKGSFPIPNVRNPSWSHPVVTGGRLYLREQDALHVYDLRAAELRGLPGSDDRLTSGLGNYSPPHLPCSKARVRLSSIGYNPSRFTDRCRSTCSGWIPRIPNRNCATRASVTKRCPAACRPVTRSRCTI
jgi:hypothetical protein